MSAVAEVPAKHPGPESIRGIHQGCISDALVNRNCYSYMNPGARSSISIEREVLKATRNQYGQRFYHNAFEKSKQSK